MNFELQEHVPLAPLTTLQVGGPARYLATCADVGGLRDALAFARAEGLPSFVLGEGSNVVVADRGYPGLVLRYADTAMRIVTDDGATVRAEFGGGAVWDDVVRWAVERSLGGIECLAGIPGVTGAAPIQNIGAYGQDVAEVIETVALLDRESGAARVVPAPECRFGYRSSRFKADWRDRFVVTSVTLRLRREAPPTLHYPELVRSVAERAAEAATGVGGGAGGDAPPSLALVRDTVLAIRRRKSMVVAPDDPESRSAGSFFTNPIVPVAALAPIEARIRAGGSDPDAMPRYAAAPGHAKLSAAWLIERAGLTRGFDQGRAGLSRNHVLALVNRDGASAEEILALARTVRAAVADAFGVVLVPEPALVGFPDAVRAEFGQV